METIERGMIMGECLCNQRYYLKRVIQPAYSAVHWLLIAAGTIAE